MRLWRIGLATAGLLPGGFGLYRLMTEIPLSDLLVLAGWLLAAVAVHDGALAPVVVGVGWLLGRRVPPRSRRYAQGALIAGGLIAVVAGPMIVRMGQQPASKALLQQPVGVNVAVLLGIVATSSAVLYAVRVLRDHRPPADGASRTGPSQP